MNSKTTVTVTLSIEQALFIKQAVQNSRGDEYDELREQLFNMLPSIQDLYFIIGVDKNGLPQRKQDN